MRMATVQERDTRCPNCNSQLTYRHPPGRFECPKCGYETPILTSGGSAASNTAVSEQVIFQGGTDSVRIVMPRIPDHGHADLEQRIVKLENQITQLAERMPDEEELEPLELQVISKDKAKPLIEKYVSEHPGSWTSDIAIGTGLNVDLVVEVLTELKTESKVRSENIAGDQSGS